MINYSTPIDSIDFEVEFKLYRVTLYRDGKYDVFAIKTSEESGKPYLYAITGPATRKAVYRAARKLAVRGSLLAEQFAQHEA